MAFSIYAPVADANPMPVTSTVVAGSTTAAAFKRGYKLPAAAGTPEVLAVDGTYVTTVTIWGIKAARTANTGTVYIDSLATNDAQAGEISPSTFIQLTAPAGKVIDLNDIYVDIVDAGDGVFYWGML